MRSRRRCAPRGIATTRVFVAYADCGTGGLLAARCADLGVEMIAGPHCYSFFDGNAAFAARGDAEMRAFYLTDFLVRQFDAFVWRPIGLDRHPELRDQIFAGYETARLSRADRRRRRSTPQAARCAARLGLAYRAPLHRLRRSRGRAGAGDTLGRLSLTSEARARSNEGPEAVRVERSGGHARSRPSGPSANCSMSGAVGNSGVGIVEEQVAVEMRQRVARARRRAEDERQRRRRPRRSRRRRRSRWRSVPR